MNRFRINRPQLDKDLSKSTVISSELSVDHSLPPYRINVNSMSINSHALTIKTVHSLEAELIRLRESTKDALQQSWGEVETLQQQCAAHLDITNQLENDVVEARRKEEYWHKRCLEAEFKLLQGNQTETQNTSKNKKRDSVKNPMLMMTWPMTMRGNGNKDALSVDEDHSLLELESEHEDNLSLQENHEKVIDLEIKLQDRELAVTSLERTVERHVKAMHSMQAEMQCMMETQRIKEKKKQTTFRRKESFFEEQISTLEREIKKKETTIATHRERSSDYKNYIRELVSELERVLGILQNAERNGVNLNEVLIRGD